MWWDLALVQILAHFDLLSLRVIYRQMLAVHRSLHLSLVVSAARRRMMLVLRARLAHHSARSGATPALSHNSRVVLHARRVLRVLLHDLLSAALLTSNACEFLVLLKLRGRLLAACRVELERHVLGRVRTTLRDKLEARALADGGALFGILGCLLVMRGHHRLMHGASLSATHLQARRLLRLRRRRKVTR